jgi:hypothetical protein
MALETGSSLHRGHDGEPGGGSFTGDFERRAKESSGNGAFLYGSPARGIQWEESFAGEPEGYITEGSGHGHLSA